MTIKTNRIHIVRSDCTNNLQIKSITIGNVTYENLSDEIAQAFLHAIESTNEYKILHSGSANHEIYKDAHKNATSNTLTTKETTDDFTKEEVENSEGAVV